MKGLNADAVTATFSKGVVLPELVYVAFQGTFAAITVCLVVGGFAERMKFSAAMIFMVVWFTIGYLPIAHMVWFWEGPDAYTSAAVADGLNAKAGLLWQWGALDFAGGTVVHINAGVAGGTAHAAMHRIGKGLAVDLQCEDIAVGKFFFEAAGCVTGQAGFVGVCQRCGE